MPTFFLLRSILYVNMSKNYLLPLSFLAVAAGFEPATFRGSSGVSMLDRPNPPLFIPSTGTRVFLLLFATLYIFYLPSSLIPSQSASRFSREPIISAVSCRHTARPLCSSLSGAEGKPTVSLSSLRSSASPSRASVAVRRHISLPSP